MSDDNAIELMNSAISLDSSHALYEATPSGVYPGDTLRRADGREGSMRRARDAKNRAIPRRLLGGDRPMLVQGQLPAARIHGATGLLRSKELRRIEPGRALA